MRILLYEPLADINRAPFIRALCCYLRSKGHQVVIVLEAKVLYTLKDQFQEKPVLDNRGPIYYYLGDLPLVFLPESFTVDSVFNTKGVQAVEDIKKARRQYYRPLLEKFDPKRIFIWNGNHDHQRDFMSLIDELGWGERMFYAEMGWFPQKEHVFFDRLGVAGASEIAHHRASPLDTSQQQQLQQWLNEFSYRYGQRRVQSKLILVPLQIDSDTNITHFSDHFGSMNEFVDFLQQWVPEDYQVIVRPHPLAGTTQIELYAEHFSFDTTTSLAELLCRASLVIGLNSTVLLEALALNIPTIAFARGIFGRSSGIEASITPSSAFPSEFAIDQDKRQGFLYELVFVRQLRLENLKKGQGNRVLDDIIASEYPESPLALQAVGQPANWRHKCFGVCYVAAYYLWQRLKRWLPLN